MYILAHNLLRFGVAVLALSPVAQGDQRINYFTSRNSARFIGGLRKDIGAGLCVVESSGFPDPRSPVSLRPNSEYAMLSEIGQQTPGLDTVLFVHGFNVRFAAGCRATARLRYGMDLDVVPILFSWPASGHVVAYLKDERAAEASAQHFAQLVSDLQLVVTPQRLHIVAHSMGARTSVQGLLRLISEGVYLRIGDLILIKPDINNRSFRSELSSLLAVCERVVVYASESDHVLFWSRILHAGARAGQETSSANGLEVVDVSRIPTPAHGHSMIDPHHAILRDIGNIIAHRRRSVTTVRSLNKQGQQITRYVLEPRLGDPALSVAVGN